MAESFIERNPWSPGVAAAVVLFVIGTGITLHLRFRDKQSKTLDYRIVSDIPIITSHNKPELLTITFGKRDVQNPILTEVRFMNTGKKVIEPDDYLNELIVMRESAKVLDFNITDESEPNLTEHISHTYDGTANVVIEPRTLNPGDWFTAQILYDGDINQKDHLHNKNQRADPEDAHLCYSICHAEARINAGYCGRAGAGAYRYLDNCTIRQI